MFFQTFERKTTIVHGNIKKTYVCKNQQADQDFFMKRLFQFYFDRLLLYPPHHQDTCIKKIMFCTSILY